MTSSGTSSDLDNPVIERALVLSGGGARGAYQVGVIKYLNELGWIPDMICGTSIGAINAVAWGSGMTVDQISALWFMYDRKKIRRFSLRGFLNTLKNRRKYSPPADIRSIRTVLETHIDIHALRKSKTRILISALNMKTGQIRYFTNKIIDIHHIMAATAIPMVFPWQYIDGIPHWDAGLMANTPIAPALALNAREIIVVLHSPVGAFETDEPKTGKQALNLAVEHMLIGSYTALLPDNTWRLTPNAEVFDTPRYGSPGLDLSLNDVTLRIVAPPEILGIESMFNYSMAQAKKLINEGYTNAKMQLGPFLA